MFPANGFEPSVSGEWLSIRLVDAAIKDSTQKERGTRARPSVPKAESR